MSGEAAELRTPVASDAAAIAALARATFVETFGHLYAADDLAAFIAQHVPAEWARQIADPAFAIRLARIGDADVGYAKLGPPALPFVPPAGAIELRQIYVLAAHHGAGVAQRLMRWAIGEAAGRGGRALYLSVFTRNVRARRFYARHGFGDIGRYPFRMGNHEDEDVVMRLVL